MTINVSENHLFLYPNGPKREKTFGATENLLSIFYIFIVLILLHKKTVQMIYKALVNLSQGSNCPNMWLLLFK